jgi:transposase-like protein
MSRRTDRRLSSELPNRRRSVHADNGSCCFSGFKVMNHMAGRKKHSAEDVVRKLRRADELAGAGKTNEEIAAELGVSAATLYNWRRAYGGMGPGWGQRAQRAAGAKHPPD